MNATSAVVNEVVATAGGTLWEWVVLPVVIGLGLPGIHRLRHESRRRQTLGNADKTTDKDDFRGGPAHSIMRGSMRVGRASYSRSS